MDPPAPEMPDANQITTQLHRVLNSPRFRKSPRSREFLEYIVSESLEGRAAELDQYSIATRALDRAKDFDPACDPAARMQASRVRRALEHYFLTDGASDPVVIALPAGSYRPVFRHREQAAAGDRSSRGNNRSDWPALQLVPLQNLDRDGDLDYLSDGLMYDLANELDRYPGLRVFLSHGRPHARRDDPNVDAGPGLAVDFKLIGSLSRVGGRIRITFHLIEAKVGEQIWADEFRCAQADDELLLIRGELPQRIAATIAEEQGTIQAHAQSRLLDEESEWSDAYRAILLGYHFEQVMSPEAFSEALGALGRAVEVNSECGQAWAMLSRLWSAYFSHELSGNPEGIDRALECGYKAVALRPEDPSARASLAYALLLDGQIESCREQAETVLETNPHTLFFMDAIGYLLTLSGDWDRGSQLSQLSIQLNPYPRRVVHSGLWLDAIRRKDDAEALSHAKNFRGGCTFWEPLMRLTAGVLSGRSDQETISGEVAALLAEKPNFTADGRRLIQHYVKFPEIRSRIEEGLRGAGVHLIGTD